MWASKSVGIISIGQWEYTCYIYCMWLVWTQKEESIDIISIGQWEYTCYIYCMWLVWTQKEENVDIIIIGQWNIPVIYTICG